MTGFDRLRLPLGERPGLARRDPGGTPGWKGGKSAAEAALPGLRADLDRLQELLYADGRRGLLVVLQGMDTSGKDGVIRHVFEGVNPQGVRVHSFRAPTPEESAHDFLWRVHAAAPSKGQIAIFNRSHYEDVLVARVHHLVPRGVWSRRFRAFREFERELFEEGVTIRKFFLHLGRDEQRRRLKERVDDPTKHWKLSPSDVPERTFWKEYQAAYEEMLYRTNTREAPWFLLPSDRKWYRNLAVSSLLVGTLQGMKLRYPPASFDLSKIELH